MEQFLTPDEASAIMRVNVRSVYKWLKLGQLPSSRAGSRWLITEQNIADFLATPRRSRRSDNGVSLGAGASSVADPVQVSGSDRSVSAAPNAAGSATRPNPNPLANRKNKHHRK